MKEKKGCLWFILLLCAIAAVCAYFYFNGSCQHEFSEWKTTKTATCTANGTETRVCRLCDAKETRKTPYADHIPGDYTITTEASCTAEGQKHTYCASCYSVILTEALPKLAHTYDNEYDDTCNVCGYMRTIETPPCSHEETTVLPGYAATCTTDGMTDGLVCTACQTILEPQETINAFGAHDEISHSGKEPTCQQAGYYPYVTCRRCSYTTYSARPKVAHSYVNSVCKAGWENYKS